MSAAAAASVTVVPVPAPAPGPEPGAGGAARRHDDSLVGRLNADWARLCADPATATAPLRWAGAATAAAGAAALASCARLADVELAVRRDPDGVLLALLRLGGAGDWLALRTVFQLMLGKAVRIAATHAGRDSRADLEHAAVTALWTVVAGYPVDRRPVKVAANIAMDTLRATVTELAHQRHETPASPDQLHPAIPATGPLPGDDDRAGPFDGRGDRPSDLELIELLAWAVDSGTVSAEDATLIVDIYAPAPGCPGGKAAAARHGLSWAAARQRASRATRRIAEAVRADGPALAPAHSAPDAVPSQACSTSSSTSRASHPTPATRSGWPQPPARTCT